MPGRQWRHFNLITDYSLKSSSYFLSKHILLYNCFFFFFVKKRKKEILNKTHIENDMWESPFILYDI